MRSMNIRLQSRLSPGEQVKEYVGYQMRIFSPASESSPLP
jgi:hypothetical protein